MKVSTSVCHPFEFMQNVAIFSIEENIFQLNFNLEVYLSFTTMFVQWVAASPISQLPVLDTRVYVLHVYTTFDQTMARCNVC